MELTDLHEGLLLAGLFDYIHIGDPLFHVMGRGYLSTQPLPQGVRQRAIQLISDLLEMGLIEAGNLRYGPDEFKPWNLSPQETIRVIENEWDHLDHTPVVGEIVWFRLTPLGEEIAKEIDARENADAPDGLA